MGARSEKGQDTELAAVKLVTDHSDGVRGVNMFMSVNKSWL